MYIRVVQDMYKDYQTIVRCSVGITKSLSVEVRLHQGSALSLFLFAIIMGRLTVGLRNCAPCMMMFAHDIVLCSEYRDDVEVDLRDGDSQWKDIEWMSAEARQSICA